MSSFLRARNLDAGAWRVATVSTPFVVQINLGLLLATMWVLGKGPFTTERGHTERTWALVAAVITTLVSLALAAVLGWSPSPRNRGLALSIVGSSGSVLTGAIIYAYLVLR